MKHIRNSMEKTYMLCILIALVFIFKVNDATSQCTSGGVTAPATVNGVNVTGAGTGAFSNAGFSWTSCSYTMSPGSLWLGNYGAGTNTGTGVPFSYTYTFSQPVNNVGIIIASSNNGEDFAFVTSAGVPSISSPSSCYSVITNNHIIAGPGEPPTGGGGAFIIHGPSAYTTITITGTSFGNGSLFALCGASIIPCVLPTIGTQPTSKTVCVGTGTTFSGVANGAGPYTYQWLFNGSALIADHSDVNGTYTGSTTATLNFTPGTGSYFYGGSFSLQVTNACGSITSSGATITVKTIPTTPVITTTAPTCAVLTGSINVQTPVSGITYTLSPGGATSTTGVFSGLAAGSGPYTVTGSNGTCSSVVSNSVSIGAAANCPIPDLRPIISMPTRNFIKTSQMSRPMTIRVYNIGPVGTTTTGTIRVYLSLGSNFTATLSTGSAWTITDDGGGEYTLSTTSAIPRASTAVPSDIPLVITAAAGVTKGSYNLSLAIEDLAGGETNIVNNGATADINVALD